MTIHVNRPEEVPYFQNLFNRNVLLNKVPNTHPHANLAQLRRQYEFEITLGMFPLVVADIGAGTRSLSYGLTNVYNIMPVLSSADKGRQIKRLKAMKRDPFLESWCCQCKFPACRHINCNGDGEGINPDILLSIDSSYYDGVLDAICDIVSKQDKTAFVAFHAFDLNVRASVISFAGKVEGQYTLFKNNNQDWVEMTVKGNPCAYTHKVHPLNSLYTKSALVYNGCYCTVIKAAKFDSSAYLLVQLVQAQTVSENANLTSSLHEQVKLPAEVMPKQSLVQTITNYDINKMKKGYYYVHKTESQTTYYRVVNAKLQSYSAFDEVDQRSVNLAACDFDELVSVTDLNRIVTNLLTVKGEIEQRDILGAFVRGMSGKAIDVQALTVLIVEAVRTTRQLVESSIQILQSEDVKEINRFKSGRYVEYPGWSKRMGEMVKWLLRSMWYNARWYFFFFGIFIMAIVLGMKAEHMLSTIERMLYLLVGGITMFRNYAENRIMNFIGVQAMDNGQQAGQTGYVDLALGYLVSLFAKRVINRLFNSNPRRQVKTSCISKDNYSEVSGDIMPGKYEGKDLVDWKVKIPAKLTCDEFLACNCGETSVGLVQVMPEIAGAEEPIIYHVCSATNYCAAKRQVTAVPKPDDAMILDFQVWFEGIFQREIRPLLDRTTISVKAWLNHLSAHKQRPVLKIHNEHPEYMYDDHNLVEHYKVLGIDASTDYEMFVKSEKQLYSEGKAPKNRCICAPNSMHKYVMGPVCWTLENTFKNFHGYCGGASWADLEMQYDQWEFAGLTQTLQLDGSGFDRTQHQVIKDIVDQRIYSYLAEVGKIWHVPVDTFLRFALSRERKVKVTHRSKDCFKQRVIGDGYFKQIGAVFSGSADTTLMNTLRMSLYNRYVCERLCGLEWGAYEVKSKGDDTVAVFRTDTNMDFIIQNYKRAFVYGVSSSKYSTTIHGLGQIAKYFKIGTIEDIDFCSTETVWCPRMGGYKILRQLKRFATTTVWSRSAKSLGFNEFKIYCESLYQSNLCWMNGIPIYRVINYYLHKNVVGLFYKTKNGTKRITFEGESLDDMEFESMHETSDVWKLGMRKSNRIPHELDMLEYFGRKYGWSFNDVYMMERQLAEVTEDWTVDCPMLEQITH